MKGTAFLLGLALTGATAVGAISGLHAEEQKTKFSVLLKTALTGMEGKEVTMVYIERPPGWVGPRHYHPGHVFFYVLEGSVIMDIEGLEPTTVGPGEVFHELPNQVVNSKNASATTWLKRVVFLLGDEGKHPTVTVE